MRRTSIGDVVATFVLLAVLSYALMRLVYGQLPALHWLTAVPLVLLAVAEIVAARRVRAAIGHRPGYQAVTAIAVARCAALGKASLLGGVGVAGVATGVGLRVLPDLTRTDAARHDGIVAVLVLAAGALLAVSGTLLEGATIDPSRRRR